MVTRQTEDGFVVVLTLLVTTLVGVVVAGLVRAMAVETAIAGNFRDGVEARHAAEAGLERAMADLPDAGNWTPVLRGAVTSTFVDGPPSRSRTLADGHAFDLPGAVNQANCGKAATCSSADMDAVTAERPWGRNNPRWRAFAHGRMADLLPGGTVNSPFYLLVLVADDPAENDADPSTDGALGDNPGAGLLLVRSEALGPGGLVQRVEATVARVGDGSSGPTGSVLLSWRVVR